VVVLSHALWRQRVGADVAIIGRDILIDSEPRTVAGVMPPTFRFPSARTQLWIPYAFDRSDAAALWGGGQRGQAVARLAPRTTTAQAQAELRGQAPELRKANTLWVMPPAWGANREVVLLQERLVGDVRTRLLVILGAVGFVLLIACANVANLLLARASARQREVAIRRALGAGRSRIVRQVLTESAVLGLLGGTAGLLLAFGGVHLLASGMSSDVPRVEEIGVDRWVLGFTLVTSMVTGLGFGAIPAIRSSRSDVQASLKPEERGSSGSFGRAAGWLVVGEVAVAVLLVTGAGLLIRSFAELLRVDPGFRSARIITARVTPPESRYADEARKRVWNDDWITVVGVVGDVRYDGLASAIEPGIYRPFLQTPARNMSLVVRAAHDAKLAGSLREAVASVDATVPASEIRTVDQLLASSVAAPRFTTLLLAAFATVALTLAAIGIYGMLSYAVSRRTREIGVRMALGARRVDVLRLVLGHALLLAGVGTIVGMGAALATTRVLEGLLFGVSRTDVVTFAAVPMLLVAVAFVAAYVPANRATRVDPTVALRLE
jgi:cell division protein FtsX